MGCLDGVLVLDLSRKLPGPYGSMVLADHGARVITMEDRRFQGEGSFPTLVNRNKEHMALNLKTEAGREIFFKLAARADVVLEGFRPGVLDDLGIGYEAVSAVNPKIIYCSISGYGQDGPFRERPGHDINYLAESGILELMGGRGAPRVPGIQVADIAGGSMHAVTGILMALFEREKTGKGQAIDISMADCCVPMHAISLELWQLTGEEPKRSDAILSHRYAFYHVYGTSDGRHLALGALEPHFWKGLCEHFKVPEFASLQFDENKRDEIIDFFTSAFSQQTLAVWEKELGHLPICFSSVKTLPEVMGSPLFEARGMILPDPGGDDTGKKTFGVPIKMSRTPGAVNHAPEPFGTGGPRILQELGYGEREVASLLDTGVI